MLHLENIGYSLHGANLFSGISLNLFESSLLQVVGTNGSGKTSLLKILASLIEPSCGNVYCNDIDIFTAQNEYHSIMQFISNQNALYEELTILQNLAFWSNVYGSGGHLIQAALHALGVDNLGDIKVSKLSSGLKRRVALARLICCPAKIWIIDEADAYLDKKACELLRDMILARVNQQGIVIYTSHSDNLSFINKAILDINDYKDF